MNASSVAASWPGIRSAIAAATRSTGSRVPITPVDRARVRAGCVPSAVRKAPRELELVGVAGCARRGVGRAGRREDRVGPAATRGDHRRQSRKDGPGVSRTGAAANALRVKTPAAAAGAAGRRDHREVRPAGPLDPDRGADRPEARRQDAPVPRRRQARRRGPPGPPRRDRLLAHGTSGSCSSPAVSGQPVDQVEGLDRLAGGALDQVVDDADGEDPAGPLVDAHVDAAGVAAQDVLGGRGLGHDVDERLVAVGVGVERVELGLRDRAGRADVARRQDAARHRDEVGQEVDAADARVGGRGAGAPASAASSCSISATCRWPPTP